MKSEEHVGNTVVCDRGEIKKKSVAAGVGGSGWIYLQNSETVCKVNVVKTRWKVGSHFESLIFNMEWDLSMYVIFFITFPMLTSFCSVHTH